VIINSEILCPKSWKILFLLEEYKIPYTLKEQKLSNNYNPIINNNSDFSYILTNLSQFMHTHEELTIYGNWINIIECNLIPLIILPIRRERVINPLINRIYTNLDILKEKRNLLKTELIFFAKHFQNHEWITNTFSIIDITLASSIAILDYLGEIPWKEIELKELYHWHSKIKSKKSFQIILKQSCPGIAPHSNFKKIDF